MVLSLSYNNSNIGHIFVLYNKTQGEKNTVFMINKQSHLNEISYIKTSLKAGKRIILPWSNWDVSKMLKANQNQCLFCLQ